MKAKPGSSLVTRQFIMPPARANIGCFHSTKVGSNALFTATARTKSSVATKAAAEQVEATTTTQWNANELWTKNMCGETWLDGSRDLAWFTGKAPIHGVCPGVGADGVIRSLPLPDLNNVTRKSTQKYFDNTWTLYETLFAGLNGETPFYQPPQHGLRHPQIFYYGHTTCFYINKLQLCGWLDKGVDSYLESVLEVGVDEMLWDDMHTFENVWPSVQQVKDYRKTVYRMVTDAIANHPALEDNGGKTPIKVTPDHPCWAFFMAFEHERIHLETSSVLFREMPLSHVQPPSGWPAPYTNQSQTPDANPAAGVHYPENEMLKVAGGEVELGKPTDHPSFGWDNEYGQRNVSVPDFAASKFMITNGEFYGFVKAGGYNTDKYWCQLGWEWRKYRNIKWPFFWQQNGPQGSMRFKLRTVFEAIDMPWSAPVDVNYYEARAYCAWKAEKDGLTGTAEAYRVITEAEHNLLRPVTTQQDNVRAAPLSDRVSTTEGRDFCQKDSNTNANSNLAWGSSTPVDYLLPSESGHHDTMGNAWEWTEDHFNPLEGFSFHPYYNDFSTPCFDGRHNMIMGGSFVSTGLMAGTFARFHFRPHFLQHSGFRLVSSAEKAPSFSPIDEEKKEGSGQGSTNIYETNDLVDQYLGFHFAQESGKVEGISAILPHENLPEHALRFPQRVSELLFKLSPVKTNGRVLDVGCAVGGSSFELATKFDAVVGFDFSQAFVDAAEEMRTVGSKQFQLSMEAGVSESVVAVHEKHVDEAARRKIQFQTGDACHMEEIEGTFDGAVVANLLCRVPEPLLVLDGLSAKLNQGGVVVLSTPFSWLEQFTNKENWLGGYHNDNGVAVYSKDTLKEEMEARGFTKIHEEQMPVLIREHRRKYQYIISEATAWRKL